MLYVGTSKMTPRVLAVWAETLRGQKLTGLDLKKHGLELLNKDL